MFDHISHLFIPRMRNVSGKLVEKIKMRISYSITFFFFENRAVYAIMWKNVVGLDRPQVTIWRMRIACWIPKTTNTHSEYVILIAFPLQQWLHERTSILSFTYIACVVVVVVGLRLVAACKNECETI